MSGCRNMLVHGDFNRIGRGRNALRPMRKHPSSNGDCTKLYNTSNCMVGRGSSRSHYRFDYFTSSHRIERQAELFFFKKGHQGERVVQCDFQGVGCRAIGPSAKKVIVIGLCSNSNATSRFKLSCSQDRSPYTLCYIQRN